MLSLRDLNRTLLGRQHLLARTGIPVPGMVAHLLGLQAQQSLPPYLSLAARLEHFDPWDLSAGLERRALVRMTAMRGTVHVLTSGDAPILRSWVQPALDRAVRSNQLNRAARHLSVEEVVAATREVLREGPLPVARLGERLAERFPGVPADALAHRAREHAPLVQLPPRGLWQRSGGVVYQTVEQHLGRETGEVDVEELVVRYLRAFGPATASDMTTWSRVTRLGPLFRSMRERGLLVEVTCADGRTRYDAPGAPYVPEDADAPVRLLGVYDNVWLSHADRTVVMPDQARSRWMAVNGGAACTVFVDGFMAGLWAWREGRVELDVPGVLSRSQRADLDDEVQRVTDLMRTPAAQHGR